MMQQCVQRKDLDDGLAPNSIGLGDGTSHAVSGCQPVPPHVATVIDRLTSLTG
jgi:hypothetical protein